MTGELGSQNMNDHDLLVRIDERVEIQARNTSSKLESLENQMNSLHEKLDSKADVSSLLRAHERMDGFDAWKSRAIGAGSVIVFIISLAATLVVDRVKNMLK
jgi:hypothetical protein